MRVKIIGAGSIGNHLAQASRRMGWDVVVADIDPEALKRMKDEIYPSRYGQWDDEIQLLELKNAPKGGFDIIMIGTPPHVRMDLAVEAMEENPGILHLEKPLCTPHMERMDEFIDLMKENPDIFVTVGYDHAVAESIERVSRLLKDNTIGEVLTMDVEFREHWKGIFQAHSWLSGPQDSYLGFWSKGGGAGGEHSHALHLWLYFSNLIGWGNPEAIRSMMDIKKENDAEYDRLAAFLLKAKNGKFGRVVQDVITLPVRKWARFQGDKGFIEWHCGGSPEGDLIKYQVEGNDLVEDVVAKKRPDDFYRLVQHYQKIIDKEISIEDSPINFDRGLEVIKILHKAYNV